MTASRLASLHDLPRRLVSAIRRAFLVGLACFAVIGAPALAAAPASISEAMGAIAQIARELRVIDARLGKIEGSIGGLDKSLGDIDRTLQRVDASLAPVGALAQPDALRNLVLLVTACAAGLIVLHAVLRRWSNRPRP